jgi:hypothetical protein
MAGGEWSSGALRGGTGGLWATQAVLLRRRTSGVCRRPVGPSAKRGRAVSNAPVWVDLLIAPPEAMILTIQKPFTCLIMDEDFSVTEPCPDSRKGVHVDAGGKSSWRTGEPCGDSRFLARGCGGLPHLQMQVSALQACITGVAWLKDDNDSAHSEVKRKTRSLWISI